MPRVLARLDLRGFRRFQRSLRDQQARTKSDTAGAFNRGPPAGHPFRNIDSDDHESLNNHDPGQAGDQLRILLDIG